MPAAGCTAVSTFELRASRTFIVLKLLLGMALRLAFHLALHMDMAAYVEAGSLRPEEAELRRVVFWAAFTADQ